MGLRALIASAFFVCALVWAWSEPGPTRTLFFRRRGEDGRPQNPDLLYFRGETDKYSEMMEPLNRELAREGFNMKRFEVWYNTRNTELMQHLDLGRCGGVPYYYNKNTKRFICGATDINNLRNWAAGDVSDPFHPPDDLVKPEQPPNERWEMVKAVWDRGSSEVDDRTKKQRKQIKKDAKAGWKNVKAKYEDFRNEK
jgi:hypothetical protein